jgi:hypothetical protein
MQNVKQEALNAIAKLPETADMEEIMYRLYVIEKVRKGQEAIEQGKVISVENLKKEILKW